MVAVAIDPTRMAQAEWEGLDKEQRAAVLDEALTATDVSQTALMKALDVSYTTVNRWKQGHAPISWARWVSICSVLRIPTSWRPGHKVPDRQPPEDTTGSH